MIHRLIVDLNMQFALKVLGPVHYFLGFEVQRTSSGIHLTQTKYIRDLLLKTRMQDASAQPTPMCQSTKLMTSSSAPLANPTLYRSIIGALQYLTMTRPDISFAVNRLSQYLKTPTMDHWTTCKRVLRYLVGTPTLSLHFKPTSLLDLQAFTNAGWAGNLDDRKSTTGYCVLLGGNLISCFSKKQTVIARSSTESEYRAMASATAELIWIQSLVDELCLPVIKCPTLWCDNVSSASLASNPVFHAQTKHIEVDLLFVRDRVLDRLLDVRYIPSDQQTADIFTKPLSIPQFEFLCNKLTLKKAEFNLRGVLDTWIVVSSVKSVVLSLFYAQCNELLL